MSGRERFRIHVLGRFRVLTGDAPIVIPSRLRKPQALPRVAGVLPRHSTQRQDASPLSQRARARGLPRGRKRAVNAGGAGVDWNR